MNHIFRIIVSLAFVFGLLSQILFAQTCVTPTNVAVDSITAYSAVVSWNEVGTAFQWSVEYGPAGFAHGTGTTVLADQDNVELTDLAPNQTYNLYVRSICDADDSSAWTTVYSFQTPCFEIDSFPFLFDMHESTFPVCWTRPIGTYPDYTYSSNNSYAIAFWYTSSIVAFPKIAEYDTNGDTIDLRRLKLNIRSSQYESDDFLWLGVMTDPTDFNSFQPVQKIVTDDRFAQSATCDYEAYLYDYTGTGRYVALKNEQENYVTATRLELEYLPYTCGHVKNVRYSHVAGTSALVSWDEGPVGDAADYTIEYSESGQDVWTTAATNCSATHFFLTGLSPRTWYDVRVKTNCQDSTSSAWYTTHFQTACLAGGLARIGNGTATTESLPVYSDPNNSYATWQYAQLFFANELNGPGDIQSVSFQADNPNLHYRHWTIYLKNTNLSSLGNNVTIGTLQQVFDDTVHITNDWFKIYFDTPFHYDGVSNLVMMVVDNPFPNAWCTNNYYYHTCNTQVSNPHLMDWDDNGSYTTYSIGYNNRSNVIFETACDTTATCFKPNLLVDNIMGTTVDLIWAAGYQETAWELEYKRACDTVWIPYNNPTGFHATLTNLNPSDDYQVRIRAICSSTNQSEWQVVDFRTGCGPLQILPYTMDFENTISVDGSDFAECWDRHPDSANVSVIEGDGTTPSVDTNHVLKMEYVANSSPIVLAVLPELDNAINLTNLLLEFNAKLTDHNCLFEVGVMTDPTDTSTFTPVNTIIPLQYWSQFAVDFSSYMGNGRYIAFRLQSPGSTASRQVFIDDVVLDHMPFCQRPLNVSLINTNNTSAIVTWQSPNAPAAWEVEYGLHGFEPGTGTVLTVTSNMATLQGLAYHDVIDVYVRAVCDATHTSDNSNVFTFEIPIDCSSPLTMPYLEHFETTTTIPECWSQLAVTGNVSWTAVTPTSYPSSAHSGTTALRFKNNKITGETTRLISPELDLTNLADPILKFWHTQIKWDTDQDTLAVYYRTSGTDTWHYLASYSDEIADWRLDSLYLPNPSAQYQIAFEGTARYGRGIYLDDVSITYDHVLTCEAPYDISIVEVHNHSAMITWTINAGEVDSCTVLYHPVGTSDWRSVVCTNAACNLTDLQGLTVYEVYILAHCCNGLTSGPSDSFSFTTTNTGISQHDLEKSVRLYPNPNNGQFTISTDSDMKMVEIFDIYGKLLKRVNIGATSTSIDLQNAPSGTYFVRIHTPEGMVTKVMVRK